MALPIRQRLSALTCLKAGPKAVLIEVCELAENAGRGCFASNDTLAKKLGVSLATVTRTIASLVGYELLSSRVVAAEANRRYLAPTATVVACYKGGTEAEQLAAVSGLTIVKSEPAPELTIVKPGTDYSQNGKLTIVKNDADYSQNASRVIGDDQYDQLESQDDQSALRSEWELAQKKIGELSAQLNEALDSLATCRATITTLRAEAEASRTRGAAGVTPIASTLPYASQEFAACWQEYRAAQGIAPNGPRERALLKSLAGLAATETEALATVSLAIRKGWKDLYKLDESRPNSHSQRAPANNERGAKPTGTGALGARALAEHFAAVDAAAAGSSIRVVGGGATTGFNPS